MKQERKQNAKYYLLLTRKKQVNEDGLRVLAVCQKNDIEGKSDFGVKDEEGNVKVYASSFVKEEENTVLSPIETEREWKIVETILESIKEEAEKNEE